MKHHVHREKLLFTWTTTHHQLVAGFKRVRRNKCNRCGRLIPEGNTLCNECFELEKPISKK
ncbi:MAG: hypothetical protein JW771_08105 [Candidatus Thermoplasmatota archaeon]|nr:hypothetical protein [Candidatus Thermoplasmatota archaeon]